MKGPQMYKIYVNRTRVILLATQDLPGDLTPSDDLLVSSYSGKVKNIFNYLDMFEKSDRIKTCYIYADDLDKLKSDFKSVFKTVPAWYLMRCHDQKLVPQTEEDITEATWMSLSEFDKLGGPVFKNISDVLDTIR